MRLSPLLLLLLSTISRAATFVVAAGVETYDDQNITALKYSVPDARAFVDVFRDAGTPDTNLFLLTTDSADRLKRPTKFAILHSLQRVREKAEEDDTVIFFFAGHGMEHDGQAYLLTSDSLREGLEGTALPMKMVQDISQGFRSRQVLFVIDACRNDPNSGRAAANAQLDDSFARDVRPRVMARSDKPATAALLLACEVGQRAWEMPDENHGAFTYYLLQGLGGKCAGADGNVRLSALAAYVTRAVPAWAGRNQRQQNPRYDNPTRGDFVLCKPGSGSRADAGAGQRPANWPSYLGDFTPPSGMNWSRYRVCEQDGMPQVLVPSGEFLMGGAAGKQVYVSAFWMDLHTVTNAQFGRFLQATGYPADDRWRQWYAATGSQHPATYVPWGAAAAYADWVGRQLPTEAQWEKAARGGTTTAYPWGDQPDPHKANIAWGDERWHNGGDGFRRAKTDALIFTQPVCSFPPNPFGLFDAIGNTWEWCRDYFSNSWPQDMPTRDPVNTTPERTRTLRSSNWCSGPKDGDAAVTFRLGYSPTADFLFWVGFRCSAPAS